MNPEIAKLCVKIIMAHDGFQRVGPEIPMILEEMRTSLKEKKELELLDAARKLINCGSFYQVTKPTMDLVVELEKIILGMSA